MMMMMAPHREEHTAKNALLRYSASEAQSLITLLVPSASIASVHEAIINFEEAHPAQPLPSWFVLQASTVETPKFASQLGVLRPDIDRMQAMGQGALPLCTISLPLTVESLKEPVFPYQFMLTPSEVQHSVKDRLGNLLPARLLVALYELQSILNRLSVNGYVIGGLARELMRLSQRRLTIKDVDITLEANAHEVAKAIEAHSRNFKVLEVHPSFGTAKLTYKHEITFDLASTREEVYAACGALPQVLERGVGLSKDILRRDFTVNTLALSIHQLGDLLDFCSGLTHLNQHLLHPLHGSTFFEDPSRVFRAFKFACRLTFQLSPACLWLMQQFFVHAGQLPFKGGGARVKTALQEWLALPPSTYKHDLWLQWLEHGGLIALVARPAGGEAVLTLKPSKRLALKEKLQTFLSNWPKVLPLLAPLLADGICLLSAPDSCALNDDALSLEERLLWLCSLCYLIEAVAYDVDASLVSTLANRLELTKQERETVQHYLQFLQEHPLETLHPEASVLAMTQAFDYHNPVSLMALIMVSPNAVDWMEPLIQYLRVWRTFKPALQGDALLALGVPAGEAVGKVLKALRAGYLTKQLHSVLDEETYVKQWLKQQQQ
jgi:hypothetical protein